MDRVFELKGWLQRLYRQGPYFHRMLAKLEQSGRFTTEQIAAYQNHHLQRVMHHCYRNVPYYRDLFHQLHLKPEDIQTPADLRKLPFLSKELIRENFDKLIAKNHCKLFCKLAETSGSTGAPGKFLRDYHSINLEHAAIWRYWREAGDTGKRRVTFRGAMIVPMTQNQPPFWKHNPANNELLMCGYHLSPTTSHAYIEKILSFRPEILYSSPSMALLLAKYFRNHGIRYRFDAVFTSSEMLDQNTRTVVEEVFNCKIYDWYGQAERVAAISQCRAGTYHIVEDYAIAEVLPRQHGREGQELVGTQLHNYIMPLLRYRTMDYIRMTRQKCTCGSHFLAIEKIIGRDASYLLTPEGYHIFNTSHITYGVDNLLETQFYQETPGKVTLRILTNGRFNENDRRRLIQNTLAHTSPAMEVVVQEVPSIPRGPNCKFISIISKVEMN